MLGTGARYAEYGITGGFFLFTQALILGLAYPDVLVWGADRFGALLSEDNIPKLAHPAIQSLLVALALLSVFIIGLVLEIIGSAFMLYEANIFRRRLAMYQWVAKFVEAELPDYAEDYRFFLDLADLWRARLKEQWKPKNWFGRRGPLGGGYKWQRKVQQGFRRLESVLIAKVLTSGAKTEMLAEQISICRMSRAIGTALSVVALEIVILISYFEEQRQWQKWQVLFLLLMSWLPFGCGLLIVLGAYSRFANMLLSLVYASWKPQTAPLAESRGERGET